MRLPHATIHQFILLIIAFVFAMMISSCNFLFHSTTTIVTPSQSPSVKAIQRIEPTTPIISVASVTPVTAISLSATPSPTSVTGCQFVYSLPAKVEVEYLIGSSLYTTYKSVTLNVTSETSTLQIIPYNGTQRSHPVTRSAAESAFADIISYLCNLEPLSSGQSEQPVHSPLWRMVLELGGGDRRTITSQGIILIENQAYTDISVSNVGDPALLLGDLAHQQPH